MKTLMLTIMAFLTVVICVYAQPAGPPPEAPPIAGPPRPAKQGPGIDQISDRELDELVEQVMAARLAKALGLNDEQTVLMVRRFGEYKQELSTMKRQRQELLKELREAIKAGLDDAQIESRHHALIEKDSALIEFKRSVYERAAEGLTISQRAKLYVFLSDFDNEMRRLVQHARERSMDRMRRSQPGPEPHPPGGAPRPVPGRAGRPNVPPEGGPAAPPPPGSESGPPVRP